MRIVRASEIGAFLYCQRAWWYQQQGIETENAAELSSGSELHEQHGYRVITSGCIRLIAIGLFILAIVLLAIALTRSFLAI